jgi:hypothetical protein
VQVDLKNFMLGSEKDGEKIIQLTGGNCFVYAVFPGGYKWSQKGE